MKKRKKLKLDEIKVESFITSHEGNSLIGGYYSEVPTDGCGCTYECLPDTQPGGTGYPCQPSGCGGGNETEVSICATCATNCGTCDCTNDTCFTCPPVTAEYTGCYC